MGRSQRRSGTWSADHPPSPPAGTPCVGRGGTHQHVDLRVGPARSPRSAGCGPSAPGRRTPRSTRPKGHRCPAGCGGSPRGRSRRRGWRPSSARRCRRRSGGRSGPRRNGPGWPSTPPERSGSRRSGALRTGRQRHRHDRRAGRLPAHRPSDGMLRARPVRCPRRTTRSDHADPQARCAAIQSASAPRAVGPGTTSRHGGRVRRSPRTRSPRPRRSVVNGPI